jgi:mitochondrial fission protein ELM1
MKKITTIIWCFIDGKKGHENQSVGLINQLESKVKCITHYIDVPAKNSFFSALVFNKLSVLKVLRKPSLIIGAGHKTHLYVLYAKFFFGGKSILLMKPSLPVKWFDLSVIPEHDVGNLSKSIYITKGPLGKITHKKYKQIRGQNLVLIGGESKHYEWDSNKIINQIKEIVENNPKESFILSSSRRTPKNFIAKIPQQIKSNIKIVLCHETNESWMNKVMAQSNYIWVTVDSYSMIYESINAAANVGVLNLKNKNTKLTKAITKLISEKKVFTWDKKQTYKTNKKIIYKSNEIEICSKYIIKRFINKI